MEIPEDENQWDEDSDDNECQSNCYSRRERCLQFLRHYGFYLRARRGSGRSYLILWAMAGGPLALLCEVDIGRRSEHHQVGERKHDNETNLLPILCPVTDLTSLNR
jgi:hypothetical protein